jgi:hypothetical protein
VTFSGHADEEVNRSGGAMVARLGQVLLNLTGTLVGVVWHRYRGKQPLEQALFLQSVSQGTCRVQELKLYDRAGRDDACG